MKWMMLVVMMLAAGDPPASQPALSDTEAKYVDAVVSIHQPMVTARENQVADIEFDLALAKRGRVVRGAVGGKSTANGKARYTFPTADAKKAEISKLDGQLSRAKAQLALMKSFPANALPERGFSEFKVGDVFRLTYVNDMREIGTYRTTQIIGPKNMLVIGYQTSHFSNSDVQHYKTKPFFVRGVETSGMIDDQEVDLRTRAFVITKSETYATVNGGTNTAFVLEAVDEDRCAKEIADQLSNRPKLP